MTDSKKTIIIAAIMVISLLGAGIFYDKAGCTTPLMGDDAKETPTPTATPTPFIKNTTSYVIVYEGSTPIKDALLSPSKITSDAVILKEATVTALKDVTYPYNISVPESKTEIKILKYRCDEKMQVCGYWIEAYRDGKQVATNSPIWLHYYPYLVTVSESSIQVNATHKEVTLTVREDPKLATEKILCEYVDRQPFGNGIVGTKE